jgi:CHAD domain-containing protein
VRETLERELKLEPEKRFVLPDLPGTPLEPRVFTSTYYDTPPLSLAHAGLTLRRRVEGGLSLWQLKLPRGLARAELEGAGGPAGPPDEIAALLAAHLRHGALEPVATLRTQRAGVRVVSGERPVADVVVDAVDVLDDGRTASGFSEIEVELIEGDEGDLARLSRVLRRAGAHASHGKPKVLRVLDVNGEHPPPKKAPASEQLRFLLEHQLLELERYDPGVRLGADPEDLHRFRVATRRSRALIRASTPLLGTQLESSGNELRWLGRVLGPVRDLDVLIAHFRSLLDELGDDRAGGETIVGLLEDQRAEAHELLLEALRSDRYLELLTGFATEVALLRTDASDSELHAIAETEVRRLRKAYAALGPHPADTELHAVRIRAKRARYAAELAAQAEGRRAAELVQVLKRVQDLIGVHQDAVVAEQRVRAIARGRALLAAGRIIELEGARRREARAELPRLWKRLERAVSREF